MGFGVCAQSKADDGRFVAWAEMSTAGGALSLQRGWLETRPDFGCSEWASRAKAGRER